MNLFRKKPHITLRSCLLALCFDPTTLIEIAVNKVLKPDLVSVVTAHMVYFCVFARSEIFQRNARKSRVGRGQFDTGVNGLNLFH